MGFNLKGATSLLRLLIELWEHRRHQRCRHYDVSEVRVNGRQAFALTLTLLPIDRISSHCTRCGLISTYVWWDGYRELALNRQVAAVSEVTGMAWRRFS